MGLSWWLWSFEEGGEGLFDHDLNVPFRIPGFNVPSQTDYMISPDSSGFEFIRTTWGREFKARIINNGSLEFIIQKRNGKAV